MDSRAINAAVKINLTLKKQGIKPEKRALLFEALIRLTRQMSSEEYREYRKRVL